MRIYHLHCSCDVVEFQALIKQMADLLFSSYLYSELSLIMKKSSIIYLLTISCFLIVSEFALSSDATNVAVLRSAQSVL